LRLLASPVAAKINRALHNGCDASRPHPYPTTTILLFEGLSKLSHAQLEQRRLASQAAATAAEEARVLRKGADEEAIVAADAAAQRAAEAVEKLRIGTLWQGVCGLNGQQFKQRGGTAVGFLRLSSSREVAQAQATEHLKVEATAAAAAAAVAKSEQASTPSQGDGEIDGNDEFSEGGERDGNKGAGVAIGSAIGNIHRSTHEVGPSGPLAPLERVRPAKAPAAAASRIQAHERGRRVRQQVGCRQRRAAALHVDIPPLEHTFHKAALETIPETPETPETPSPTTCQEMESISARISPGNTDDIVAVPLAAEVDSAPGRQRLTSGWANLRKVKAKADAAAVLAPKSAKGFFATALSAHVFEMPVLLLRIERSQLAAQLEPVNISYLSPIAGSELCLPPGAYLEQRKEATESIFLGEDIVDVKVLDVMLHLPPFLAKQAAAIADARAEGKAPRNHPTGSGPGA
jgi:hypothetical protein